MFIPKSNFYLKKINSENPELISLQLKFNGQRVVVSTGEKIHFKKWDFIGQRATGRENSELNFWLDTIDGYVKSIFRNLNIDNVPPTKPLVEQLLKEKMNVAPVVPKAVVSKLTLFQFIEQFIEETKGVRKYDTIKTYKTTLTHLKNFAKAYYKLVDFDNIDMDFYYTFSKYLAEELNHSKNTIARHIKTIKTFMNDATERGINTNMAFKSRNFKKVTEDVDRIYLTIEEIQKIYDLDLSDYKFREVVRDLFIVSCYTGLRYSDFTRIQAENIRNNQIHIRTKKTEQPVVIPIAPMVSSILKKYNNDLPHEVSNQKMNEHLKEIGRLAGINEKVTINKTEGGKRVQKTFKKYQLISAHCGRRSFATNAYKNGIPSISIMKITGHTSEKAFLGYIRISQEENAELLQSHSFFNQ